MRGALVTRPLVLWFVYVVVLLVLALTGRALWPSLTAGAAGLSALQLGVQAVLTLLPLPFAAYLGWRRVGFVRPRHLAIAAFPAATVAFGYLGPLRSQPLTSTALAVALVVLVAVGEETAFRGVLLGALRERHRTLVAVAISSALFGATHLVNLVLGAPPAGVLLQVLFSGLGAAGLAAVRIRTGSLWPPIALHAIYDLTFRVVVVEPGTPFANTVYLLHGVGWAVFAAVVLRRPPEVPGFDEAGGAAGLQDRSWTRRPGRRVVLTTRCRGAAAGHPGRAPRSRTP